MGQEFSSTSYAPEYNKLQMRFTAHSSVEKQYLAYKQRIEKEVRLCSCFTDLFCCTFCGQQTRGFFVFPCFHSACNECFAPLRTRSVANCPICAKHNVKSVRPNLTLYAISTLAMKMRADEHKAVTDNPLPAIPLSIKFEEDLMVRYKSEQNTLAVNALRHILLPLATLFPSTLLPLAHTCTSLYKAAKSTAIWREACLPGISKKVINGETVEVLKGKQSWISKYFQKTLISPISRTLFVSVTGVAFRTRDWTFFFELSNYALHCVNNHNDFSVDFIPGTTSLLCRIYFPTSSYEIVNKNTIKKRTTVSSYRSYLAQIESECFYPLPEFGFACFGEGSMGQVFAFANASAKDVAVLTNNVYFQFSCVPFDNDKALSADEKETLRTDSEANCFTMDEVSINTNFLMYPKEIMYNKSIPLVGADGKLIQCGRHCYSDYPLRTTICPVCQACTLFGTSCLMFEENLEPKRDCGCGTGSKGCVFCGTCAKCLTYAEKRTNFINEFKVPINVAARMINNADGDYDIATATLKSSMK